MGEFDSLVLRNFVEELLSDAEAAEVFSDEDEVQDIGVALVDALAANEAQDESVVFGITGNEALRELHDLHDEPSMLLEVNPRWNRFSKLRKDLIELQPRFHDKWVVLQVGRTEEDFH